MKRYAQLSTAVIFGVMTLFVTAIPLLSYKLPNPSISFWAQVPPTLAFEVVWSPVLAAILFGAAFGGLAKITSKRLGALYAACLGILISFPLSFVATLSRLKLGNFAFALTFTAFDKASATVPVAIAELSGRIESPLWLTAFSWLIGPLTGVLVWAWLRRRTKV